MIIVTLNNDWANKKEILVQIEVTLLKSTSDIIVVTDGVTSLSLRGYNYFYHAKIIPDSMPYIGVDYSIMLKERKRYGLLFLVNTKPSYHIK